MSISPPPWVGSGIDAASPWPAADPPNQRLPTPAMLPGRWRDLSLHLILQPWIRPAVSLLVSLRHGRHCRRADCSSRPSSRSKPSRIVSGCGGHPGTYKSTGSSPSTPPTTSGLPAVAEKGSKDFPSRNPNSRPTSIITDPSSSPIPVSPLSRFADSQFPCESFSPQATTTNQ